MDIGLRSLKNFFHASRNHFMTFHNHFMTGLANKEFTEDACPTSACTGKPTYSPYAETIYPKLKTAEGITVHGRQRKINPKKEIHP